jgi:hypothetical protein
MMINGFPTFPMTTSLNANRGISSQSAPKPSTLLENFIPSQIPLQLPSTSQLSSRQNTSPSSLNTNNLFSSLKNGLSTIKTQWMDTMNNVANRAGFPPFMLLNPSSTSSNNPIRQAPVINPRPNDISTRRTPQQIFRNMAGGAQQAIQDLGTMIRHQGSTMAGIGGGMALASAICAFAGGAMAATGATAVANQMASGLSQTAA